MNVVQDITTNLKNTNVNVNICNVTQLTFKKIITTENIALLDEFEDTAGDNFTL